LVRAPGIGTRKRKTVSHTVRWGVAILFCHYNYVAIYISASITFFHSTSQQISGLVENISEVIISQRLGSHGSPPRFFLVRASKTCRAQLGDELVTVVWPLRVSGPAVSVRVSGEKKLDPVFFDSGRPLASTPCSDIQGPTPTMCGLCLLHSSMSADYLQ
jgi:hypothetical protein